MLIPLIAAALIAAVLVCLLVQDAFERRQLRRAALSRPARCAPSARERFREAQRNWEQNPAEAAHTALAAAEQAYILEDFQ